VTGRRMLVLLVVLGAIGIPAGVLNALCVGRSCPDPAPEAAPIPFCPHPEDVRALLVNGYREGRSPDVLGVAREVPIVTDLGGASAPWPIVGVDLDLRVPIVFAGTGVRAGGAVPDGSTLAQIAPTVAEALGFDRPFPDVRSGTAIEGVASGEPPRLALLVVWKWTGTADLEASPGAWPFLTQLLDEGAGTLLGRTGSLPNDPTATITTIGTGGLPSEHGVTGSVVRGDDGDVVPAFGDGAPIPIISSLAEDLDDAGSQTPEIALVAPDELDRGLIGGGWYGEPDDDDVTVTPDAVGAVRSLLSTRGGGAGPDILGVVLGGTPKRLDRQTERIVRAARRAYDGSVLVVMAGTGSQERDPAAASDTDLVDAVEGAVPGSEPAVAAVVPGGIFLDREALTAEGVTGQVAVQALLGVTDDDGREIMADAFQGFAVSFARYC
jgi:hypothetical protein